MPLLPLPAATPLWKQVFGEAYAIPDDVPAGFDDISWHNDTCPSFLNASCSLRLFIDHPERDERELPEFKRFLLMMVDEAGQPVDGGVLLETDDWNEMRNAIVEAITDPASPAGAL
ncbi:hypothetical protein [Microvirga massiliensis]|uniref:hypothetical protein n=1 Tax=Microvirga massiliensis TaxID=1033741 RepID=UPI0011CBB87A|nr:hypothetical protein [Microvirga massiliensis]